MSRHEATRRGTGLRLKLRIRPPELSSLPWEFLYDPRQAEFVALSRSTPIVRYLDLPRSIQPLTVAPPLRILGMTVSTDDLPPLNVARERQRLDRALQPLGDMVQLTWLEGDTWRHLQRAMQGGPWHIAAALFGAAAAWLLVVAVWPGHAAPWPGAIAAAVAGALIGLFGSRAHDRRPFATGQS